MNNQYFAMNYGYPTLKTPTQNVNNNQRFYPVDEAFVYANIEKRIYRSYRNYQPVIPSRTSERMTRMLEITKKSSAAHDLSLFLDVFPDDNEAIKLFNYYRAETNRLIGDYERKYGPLKMSSEALEAYPWAWDNQPWPWEVDA